MRRISDNRHLLVIAGTAVQALAALVICLAYRDTSRCLVRTRYNGAAMDARCILAVHGIAAIADHDIGKGLHGFEHCLEFREFIHACGKPVLGVRSEEHTSELQSH